MLARLLADDDAAYAASAMRLDECEDAVARRQRPRPPSAETMVRVVMLEAAIWGELPKLQRRRYAT